MLFENCIGENMFKSKILLVTFGLLFSLSSFALIMSVRDGFTVVNEFPSPAGLTGSLGDLEFSADGNTVYLTDESESTGSTVYTASVNRDASNNVTSFGGFTPLFTQDYIDTGLAFAPGSSTLFYRTVPDPYYISQRTSGGMVEDTEIINYDGEYGGLAFIPAQYSNANDLLTTSYNDEQIWRHPITDDMDGTFTIGSGVLVSDVAGGLSMGDLEYITQGPLANNLIIAGYSDDTFALFTLPVNTTTGLPAATSTPVEFAEGVSGSNGVWGVAIDPVSNNIWAIDYSDSTLTQIRAVPPRVIPATNYISILLMIILLLAIGILFKNRLIN
jgi:hypothetical protein